MKNEMLPTPKDLSLAEISEWFGTDDKAREYIESILWPKGPVCPHCKNADAAHIWTIQANPSKKIRAGLRRCAECNKEFTVTVGTIFEDSHIPLRKWLIAWYLICSAKKGISALQIQRSLGLGSYRTAWMMMHKIRHALKDPNFTKKLQGTVEVDETCVGGKPRPANNQPRGTATNRKYIGKYSEKTPVVALIERNGDVRTKVVANVSQKNLRSFLGKNIHKDTT
jgi:transposase-like protein